MGWLCWTSVVNQRRTTERKGNSDVQSNLHNHPSSVTRFKCLQTSTKHQKHEKCVLCSRRKVKITNEITPMRRKFESSDPKTTKNEVYLSKSTNFFLTQIGKNFDENFIRKFQDESLLKNNQS